MDRSTWFICVTCNYVLPIIQKSIHSCKNRHECCSCKKQYNKQYYLKNRAKFIENAVIYQKEHPEINKKARDKHRSTSEWRKKHNEYTKNKFNTDPIAKLSNNLRRRIRHVLKGNFKSGSAINDLGCTVEFLRQHLESQFQPGMTWENYGMGINKWTIDHIIPLSKVNLSNHDEFLKVNHYTNLQPMWYLDNIRKSNNLNV